MLKSCLLKPIGAASHLLIFKTIYPFEHLESEIEVLWYDKEKRSTYGLKYITEASSIFSLWFQNYLSPHCTHAKSLQSCPTLWDPMDCSWLLCPWGFSRQEYWSGLPFPSSVDLPYPEMEPESLVSCIGRWVLNHWAPPGKPFSPLEGKISFF